MRPIPLTSYVFALLQLVLTHSTAFDKLTAPIIQRGALKSGVQDTLNSLLSELPSVLRNGYISDSYIFPYYDSAIANSFPRFRPEFEVGDINTSMLLDDADQSHFYYYSGNLMQDQFSSLRSRTDIAKHVHSLIREKEVLNKLTANVWLGKAGVQATAHYDSVHNVYIHLAGVKVFRLLPPSALQYLKVHGRMHPYACQSRYKHLNTGELFYRTFCILSDTCNPTYPIVSAPNDQLDNDYSAQYSRDVIELTLTPGDVLYIPPFWFHEVVAETAALSVSMWWDATQLDVMDTIYALPLPLESYWDADYTRRVTELYLSALCEAVQTHFTTLLPSNVTVPILHQLIKYRYMEDWQHQYPNAAETSEGSFDPHHNARLSIEEELHTKLDSAAQRAASLFVTGFLTEDNFASSTILDSTKTTRVFDNHCRYTSPVQCVLSNQVAILQIKLMDYVEDVFLQVSEFILGKDCEVDVITNVCVLYSGYPPMELAVKLLLDWASKDINS